MGLLAWKGTSVDGTQPVKAPAHGASLEELPGQVRASLAPGAEVRCSPAWAEAAMIRGGAGFLLALLRLNDRILTKTTFNS